MNTLLFNLMTTTTAPITEAPDMGFQPQNFVDNLSHMGNGMLGIFVVTCVIIGVVLLLNVVTNKKQNEQ